MEKVKLHTITPGIFHYDSYCYVSSPMGSVNYVRMCRNMTAYY